MINCTFCYLAIVARTHWDQVSSEAKFYYSFFRFDEIFKNMFADLDLPWQPHNPLFCLQDFSLIDCILAPVISLTESGLKSRTETISTVPKHIYNSHYCNGVPAMFTS